MQMEKLMKVNGRKAKKMEMEFKYIIMEKDIKGTGQEV